jgi:hypothetical protein
VRVNAYVSVVVEIFLICIAIVWLQYYQLSPRGEFIA